MAEDLQITQKNPLEQFILLAKNAKGAAAAQLIKQATEAAGIYVFGELMESPNLKEISQGEFVQYWNLINLFAFGTFKAYKENEGQLPELNERQITKLRHLTIVSLASQSKHIPYSVLLQELGLTSLRELEDLIIDATYAGILKGKLDQKRKELEIDFVIGRDIQEKTIDEISDVLGSWCGNCEEVLAALEKQIVSANSVKDKKIKQKKLLDTEVENLKKVIKNQAAEMQEDADGVVSSVYASQSYPKATKGKSSKSTAKPSPQTRGR